MTNLLRTQFQTHDKCPKSEEAKKENFYDIVNDEEVFQAKIDVKEFTPEQVKVHSKDRELVVECRSEQRKCEHETVTRTHTRSCALPKDVDYATLTASLKDGVLAVQCKKLKYKPVTEREIKVKLM